MRRGSRCIEFWGFAVVISQLVRIGTMRWTWIVKYISSCAWLLFLTPFEYDMCPLRSILPRLVSLP